MYYMNYRLFQKRIKIDKVASNKNINKIMTIFEYGF